MNILYAGSPEAAKKTLEILYTNQDTCDFKIVGVLSNPPSAKGRHKELIPTPVAAFAMEKNIPIFTPEHLDRQAREEIAPIKADLLVCFAYGHIFGPKFLEMFPLGGINLHPSLLPKYRGCTPVPAAILNRDEQTAATIQTLSLKMDEGSIVAQEILPLNFSETGESLLNEASEVGAKLICNLLKEYSDTKEFPKGTPQNGEPSYTGIITKDDGKINWSEKGLSIEAKVRAYYPDPGCWCYIENQIPLKIHELCFYDFSDERLTTIYSQFSSESETDTINNIKALPDGKVFLYNKGLGILVKGTDGIFALKILQRQGKNPMNYKDFMNGARDFVGTVLQ